jgi:hypothetical protein
MEHLARAALGLGLSIADYNSKITDSLKDIQDATVNYITLVKQLRRDNVIEEENLPLLLSIVGEAWGALIIR